MSASDFSDRALIAGSLTGVRGWRVDEDGELTGVFIRRAWEPGPNEATCAVEHAFNRRGPIFGPGYVARHLPPPGHPVASLDCLCGFYAFFDPAHALNSPDLLTGIVRATGVATVGEKGFRAAKAEIVAFVEPDPNRPGREEPKPAYEPPRLTWWRRFSHWLYHRPTWAVSLLGVYLTIYGAVFGIRLWHPLLAGVPLGVALIVGMIHGVDVHYDLKRINSTMARLVDSLYQDTLSDERVELVRAKYPGVPWFATIGEAVAAFPLSQQPALIEGGEQS